MSKNNKPIKNFTSGSVTGSIFVNEDENSGNKWYSLTIQKFYNSTPNKKTPNWEYTNSYNFVDLQHLNYVTRKAFEYMTEHSLKEED